MADKERFCEILKATCPAIEPKVPVESIAITALLPILIAADGLASHIVENT